MPNVIDINPLRALAKRASERIRDQAIAKRFERIAADHLLKDPRNFRPAKKADIEKAPAWAKAAAEAGAELSVWKSNSALAARLHTTARAVADALRVAKTNVARRPDSASTIVAAQKFFAHFNRVNFDTAASKSLAFASTLAAWRESDEQIAVGPAQSLVILGGRIWHRITSVAELRRVGVEFGNCLARTTSAGSYGSQLANGQAQFWVLRDYKGRGLIVAMAGARPSSWREVKGPGNALVRYDNSDLTQLGIALGIPAPPQPPPPPAASRLARAAISAAVLAVQQPCRCSLCDPLFAQRLRRPGATP